MYSVNNGFYWNGVASQTWQLAASSSPWDSAPSSNSMPPPPNLSSFAFSSSNLSPWSPAPSYTPQTQQSPWAAAPSQPTYVDEPPPRSFLSVANNREGPIFDAEDRMGIAKETLAILDRGGYRLPN